MQFKKEPVLVDYCAEAMELHLSKLSTQDLDSIVINIAKLINGEIDNLDITMSKFNEKGEQDLVKVPAMSFLRTNTIKNALMALSIPEYIITGYMNRNSFISNVAGRVSMEDRKPEDLNEVKEFIYKILKDKYGDAVYFNENNNDVMYVDAKSRSRVIVQLL